MKIAGLSSTAVQSAVAGTPVEPVVIDDLTKLPAYENRLVTLRNVEFALPYGTLVIPIFRWGARFKTNRQQKAYIGIQKLQQSYVTDNINEELSAALTKLTETEYQVKTAKETMSLANENLDLVSFSYNEGKANMVDVLSAQLSWTQAHTNLINAYLSEKMAVAEYRKVISE